MGYQNETLVADMRAAADLIESRADDLPKLHASASSYIWSGGGKEEAARIGRVFGSFNKEVDDDHYRVAKSVGDFRISFVFKRDDVCTPRCVGKKIVRRAILEGLPALEYEDVEEDVVVWDCPPLLAETP
jgi:hypothetical protein